MNILFLLVSIWVAGDQVGCVVFYVSNNGSTSFQDYSVFKNATTMDFATVIGTDSEVVAGDIIELLPGTYGSSSVFSIHISGSSSTKPVVIKNQDFSRVVIDWSIYIYGEFITIQGLEVTAINPDRYNQNRMPGVYVLARGFKLINCFIHDTGHPGVGYWSTDEPDDSELYGNIIYGVGKYDNVTNCPPYCPWVRGSGIYMQNQYGEKRVLDNIVFQNFHNGIKPYTEGGWLNGMTFEGNVFFQNNNYNFIFGTTSKYSTDPDKVAKGLVLRSNFAYRTKCQEQSNFKIGYAYLEWAGWQGNSSYHDVVIEDNISMLSDSLCNHYHGPGMFIGIWLDVVARRNTFFAGYPFYRSRLVGPGIPNSEIIDENTYIFQDNESAYKYTGQFKQPFRIFTTNETLETETRLNYHEWRNAPYSFDVNSVNITRSEATNIVKVRPNKFQKGRAHIIVFNFERRSEVAVEVSLFDLDLGSYFEIRDVENYLGDPIIPTTRYSNPNQKVILPMNLKNVTLPTGDIDILRDKEHTDIKFGCFVVLPHQPCDIHCQNGGDCVLSPSESGGEEEVFVCGCRESYYGDLCELELEYDGEIVFGVSMGFMLLLMFLI